MQTQRKHGFLLYNHHFKFDNNSVIQGKQFELHCSCLHLCFSSLSLGFALLPLLVRGLGEDDFNVLSLKVFAIEISQRLQIDRDNEIMPLVK